MPTLLLLLLAAPTPAAEVMRLEAWFAQAIAIVEGSAPALDPEQTHRRAEALAALRDYVDSDLFPQNRGPDWSPVFVDAAGTRCAMAHLLDATGEDALMWRIAATENRLAVVDLADDPDFEAWLDWHGLTLAEAAAIQPSYPPSPIWSCVCGTEGWYDGEIDMPQFGVHDWETVLKVRPVAGGVAVVADFHPDPDQRRPVGEVLDLDPATWMGIPPWQIALAESGFAAQFPFGLCPSHAPYPGPPPPLTRAQMVDALLSGYACPDTLIAIDPRWGYQLPACGCRVGATVDPPWALFGLIAAWAGRRRWTRRS